MSVTSKKAHQPTVVSRADGTKVLKELDKTKEKYDKVSNRINSFIGDVAKALGAQRHNSKSEYATFETKNGKIVTIRLADHNAKVSNFDNHEELDGISIVVTPKKNNGLTNDGNAHVVEYYYDAIKLRRAEVKPLADIVRSIKQALFSGEFKDVTGLAERQEVNTDEGMFAPVEFSVKGKRADESVLDYAKRMSEESGKKNLLNGDTGYSIKVNNKFNEDLERLTEENKDKLIFSLGRPSDVLLSAGVENKPMKLYGNKVIKKMHKHGFALEQLRNLPNAVADPIVVFDNIGREGNRSILTELKTEQGNFLVTVDLGKDADVDFNIVSSVFGKGESNIVNWINKGYSKYINKEKALAFLSHQSAPIAAAAASEELNSATKIVESFENPKVPVGNLDAEYSIKQPTDAEYEAKEQWHKDIN